MNLVLALSDGDRLTSAEATAVHRFEVKFLILVALTYWLGFALWWITSERLLRCGCRGRCRCPRLAPPSQIVDLTRQSLVERRPVAELPPRRAESGRPPDAYGAAPTALSPTLPSTSALQVQPPSLPVVQQRELPR